MIRLMICILILFSHLSAKEKTSETEKLSEAFGHLLGKNLNSIEIELDLQLVIKGLQDASKGKASPLSESECIELLSQAQEEAQQKKASTNLSAAENFLKKNAKSKGIVSLEKGKVQYRIEKQGEGLVIEEGFSPSIKYVGKYLDGSVFGQSDQEQIISLQETIPGFSKGLVGMKEGEKRTLFIHPDCGYSTTGHLQPNSLLTFEIELIKADAKKEKISNALILDDESTKESYELQESHQVR